MTDPSHVSPMPPWIQRAIAGCAVLVGVYLVATASLALSGERTLPAPFNILIVIALASTTVGLLSYGFTRQIMARFDRLEAMSHRRLNSIGNQLAEHGYQLEEITGEIPKVRPFVTACPHGPLLHSAEAAQTPPPPGAHLSLYDQGYADGLAGRPMAAEAKVFHIPRN